MKTQLNKLRWLKVFLVCCWFHCSWAYALDESKLSAGIRQVLLAEDVSAKATINQVTAGQLQFRPIDLNGPVNLGTSDSAFWLRILIENPSDQPVSRWLVIGQARLRYQTLFELKGGQWQETRGGMAEPFANRAMPTLSQAFELDLPGDTKREILVRVASETVIVIEPGLWKIEQLMLLDQKNEQVIYFISGVLILVLLFGLLLTLLVHQSGFLVYGLAALSFLLSLWGVSGLAYRELWPESPYWALHSIGFFETLSMVLLLCLHRILLKTPRYQPALDRILLVLIAFFAVLMLLIAFSPYYRILVLTMKIMGVTVAFGSPILGYLASKNDVPLSGYGFAAYTLPWQMSLIYYFASINWLPPLPPIGVYGVPLALVLSSVLILYGLGDQLNRARRARDQLEQGQRERLESLVLERTIELQQAKTVAEQALDDQRQFLRMVSHEVRSPLANIRTATQLLELRLKDEESVAILQRILRGVHRLAQFFDTYLTFDRFNTQRWALCETKVDLPVLLQSISDHFAQNTAHLISMSLSPAVLEKRWFNSDTQMLSILVNNLLENALKYSSPGSVVTISADIAENGDLQLSVSDQGVGIAAEELGLVFNKFFRSNQVGRVVGAGLGLYLVKQIVRLHEGSIVLHSEPGQGTTVILTLPKHRWIDEQ